MVLHRLLSRLLEKLGCDSNSCPDWPGFVQAVNAMCWQADDDREMLQRSLQVSSAEVMQINDELRAMMSALRESEARIRALFNATSDSAILMDAEGVILAINEHGAKRRGLAPEQMVGQSIYDHLLPDVAVTRRLRTLEAVQTRSPRTFEEEREGALYSVTIFPILDTAGVPRQLASFSRDITEFKQNEKALNDTLRMLEETQDLSRFGGWEYDVDSGLMAWSNEVYRLYGVGKDYDVNDISRNMSFYTPESAAIVSEAFRRAVEQGVPYDLDVQFVPKGGPPMWVRTMGTPQLKGGKVYRVRGNFMDVTEKKNMEIELQRSNEMLEQHVLSRTQELADTNRNMNQMLSSISSILIVTDANGRVNKWNKSATEILRQPTTEMLGQELQGLRLSLDVSPLVEGMERCRQEKQPVKIHNLRYENGDGKEGFLAINVSPILAESGELEGFLLLGDDITDLKLLEAQLSQAQRLESIGQLASGIAHEINTPIQYIGDSVTFLNDAFTELRHVLELCKQPDRKDGSAPESCTRQAEAIRDALQEMDYDFLQAEVPKSFNRVLEGIDRVSTIVQAMKRFSHPGGEEKQAVDINRAVESTLTVSHNEWKYVADLATDLAADLPPVICFPGELNQVLLNVIINASHAIADVVRGTQAKGRITVATRLEGDMVVIAIADTGTGIPEGVRDKIFDPFFTTKEVGKGTGQGLAIAYDIIVNKHGGAITFGTEVGQGSTFFIRLPIGG